MTFLEKFITEARQRHPGRNFFSEREGQIMPQFPVEITAFLGDIYEAMHDLFEDIRADVGRFLKTLGALSPEEMLKREHTAWCVHLVEFQPLLKKIRESINDTLKIDFSCKDNVAEQEAYTNTQLNNSSGMLHRLAVGYILQQFNMVFHEIEYCQQLLRCQQPQPKNRFQTGITLLPQDQN